MGPNVPRGLENVLIFYFLRLEEVKERERKYGALLFSGIRGGGGAGGGGKEMERSPLSRISFQSNEDLQCDPKRM